MKYMQGFNHFCINEETAITLGKFDGFHSGHQKLIKRILQLQKNDLQSVVFKLYNMKGNQLLSENERKKLVQEMGVSYLIECPLVPEITLMEPEAFVSEVLVGGLRAKYIVVGSDFRFGHDRKGDYKLLMELQQRYGFKVEVIKKKQYYGRDVSSTYIKEELAKGNMETVNTLLGYPFFLGGEVLHEKTINRSNGMSVIKLNVSTKKLLPPCGAYETQTLINGRKYAGITHITTEYDKGDKELFRGIETHLIDHNNDLYGESVEVQFHKYNGKGYFGE